MNVADARAVGGGGSPLSLNVWRWVCDDGGVAKCWLKFPGGGWWSDKEAREECTLLVVGAGGGRCCTPPDTLAHSPREHQSACNCGLYPDCCRVSAMPSAVARSFWERLIWRCPCQCPWDMEVWTCENSLATRSLRWWWFMALGMPTAAWLVVISTGAWTCCASTQHCCGWSGRPWRRWQSSTSRPWRREWRRNEPRVADAAWRTASGTGGRPGSNV